MPARQASAGWRNSAGRPSSRTSPDGALVPTPNRHSSSSVRPAPISPAMPRISPRRSVKLMFLSRQPRAWPGQGSDKSSNLQAPARRPARASPRCVSSISRPTIRCVTSRGVVAVRSTRAHQPAVAQHRDPIGQVETPRPSCARCRGSSRRAARSRSMTRNSRATSVSVSALVGSSMIRMSASSDRALAISINC